MIANIFWGLHEGIGVHIVKIYLQILKCRSQLSKCRQLAYILIQTEAPTVSPHNGSHDMLIRQQDLLIG